jgi:hypothetical protein
MARSAADRRSPGIPGSTRFRWNITGVASCCPAYSRLQSVYPVSAIVKERHCACEFSVVAGQNPKNERVTGLFPEKRPYSQMSPLVLQTLTRQFWENVKWKRSCSRRSWAGKPLEVTTVNLEGPRAFEVLVEVKATGICHTDEFTLSGADPEGLFPAILGHEGAGVVVEVGPGVTTLKPGDHVIPLYTPECRTANTASTRRPTCARRSGPPRDRA